MKVVAVETLRPQVQPNLLFVRLHTDDGRIGLGEAFFGACTVESYIHESVCPVLLGMADPTPERVGAELAPYAGYQGAGAEVRGNAAIDLALWDLVGQGAGLPLAALFGGPVRASLPVYNTCAGSGYVGSSTRQRSDNWGVDAPGSRYEDLQAFLTRPGELALELQAEGFTGMKIWPFDTAAEKTGGNKITRSDLDAGLAIVAAVRDAVGTDLDLMIELHGLWKWPVAAQILRALEPYQPFWVEDPVRPDAVEGYAALAAEVAVPIAAGETLTGRRGFLPLLQRNALDVAIIDVQWCGGMTESRKVAALADTFGVPVAPHDCTGPVSLAAGVHLALSAPNGVVQEVVRAFLRTWYSELVEGIPEIVDGQVLAPTAPGHGVRLRAGLAESAAVERRVSSP